MDKHLRFVAGAIVSESQLTKTSKLQLLNFIEEEASDAQIKALIMDGRIVELDEQAEEIVNDRFKLYEVKVDKKYREFEGGISKFIKYGIIAILGLPFSVILPLAFFWFYRHITDKCVKGCGGVSATKDCYNVCYLNAAKKVLQRINTELANANKIPDEKKKAKAIKKLQSEKRKWTEKVQNYQNRIKTVRVVHSKEK